MYWDQEGKNFKKVVQYIFNKLPVAGFGIIKRTSQFAPAFEKVWKRSQDDLKTAIRLYDISFIDG